MIKPNYILIIILSGFLILTNSCKKYPEDPFYSLRSSEKRLTGKWIITKIVKDGSAITSQYNDTLYPYAYDSFVFYFKFDDPDRHPKADVSVNNNTIFNMGFGIDPKLSSMGMYPPNESPIISDTTAYEKLTRLLFYRWKVRELYRKDLHLTSYYDSYELFFMK